LQRKISNRWVLNNGTINYLQNILYFSDKQITNNLKLLIEAEKKFSIIDYLSSIKKSIAKAENQQGYALTCLKNKIKTVREQKEMNHIVDDIAKGFSF